MWTASAASRARWRGATAKASACAFPAPSLKRERIAEQLTLFLNKALVDESVLRRHERTNHKDFAKFTRADGQIVNCEVMDISAGGVSLRTDIRPALGEFVLIAQTGRPRRPPSRAGHRYRIRRAGGGSRSASQAERRPVNVFLTWLPACFVFALPPPP